MIEIGVTPSGHLRCWYREEKSLQTDLGNLDFIADVFEQDGPGAALFRLAARRTGAGLTPTLAFWRDFAARYLFSLCHTPDIAAAVNLVEPPTPAEMAHILLSVPPMTGSEYLSVQVLYEAWHSLDTWTRGAVEGSGGLAAFLREHAPHWHQVGRVCFHLAENKDDPDYPFAFMATYAHGLDKAGKPRYLPLSRALTEYAGEKNNNALVRLLTPVSEAAKQSDFVSTLIESGEIYHPYPLEVGEAYRFLTEIPLYEDAGLLVRVPDWWRKRPRVQAAVTVGNDSHGKFTAESLLDFRINAAIGDERLTREELEELLAGGSGLRFVKGQWVEVDADRLRQVLDHWQSVAAQAGDGISLVEGMRLLAGAGTDLHEDEAGEEVRKWSCVSAGTELRRLLQGLRSPNA